MTEKRMMVDQNSCRTREQFTKPVLEYPAVLLLGGRIQE
jgi:hypothetical protein